jgi:hypothetical protein
MHRCFHSPSSWLVPLFWVVATGPWTGGCGAVKQATPAAGGSNSGAGGKAGATSAGQGGYSATAGQPASSGMGGVAGTAGGGSSSVSGSAGRSSGGVTAGGMSATGGVRTGGASSSGAASGGTNSGGGLGQGGASTGGKGGGAGASTAGTAARGGAAGGGGLRTGGAGGVRTGGAGGARTGGVGGASGAVCDASWVFCDDFEDGDATGWTPTGDCTWNVLPYGTTRVYQNTDGSCQSTVSSTASLTDQTVQADFRAVNFSSASTSYRIGIVARYDGSNFITFSVDGEGGLHLLRSSSSLSGGTGTCDVMAGTTVIAGFDARFFNNYKLVVQGTTGSVHITTYVNGVLVHDCTATDSGIPASGAIGILIYGSSTSGMFDYVRASSP